MTGLELEANCLIFLEDRKAEILYDLIKAFESIPVHEYSQGVQIEIANTKTKYPLINQLLQDYAKR